MKFLDFVFYIYSLYRKFYASELMIHSYYFTHLIMMVSKFKLKNNPQPGQNHLWRTTDYFLGSESYGCFYICRENFLLLRHILIDAVFVCIFFIFSLILIRSGLSTIFVKQQNIINPHGTIHCLAHIINR